MTETILAFVMTLSFIFAFFTGFVFGHIGLRRWRQRREGFVDRRSFWEQARAAIGIVIMVTLFCGIVGFCIGLLISELSK